VAPKKYFELYDLEKVSLAPNRFVPTGFKEENFHADGTFELITYNLNAGPQFRKDHQDFETPLDEDFSRLQRRGYFAATSFTDANVGRMLSALESYGYKENTIVLLWGDHGWRELDARS
jgi:iduronate 2-sulfatase